MTTYQELIDAEIGALPPSTVDVDAVVRRQRRLARTRRTGVVVAAGVVAATLVTGIGILQQAGGVRSPDAAAQASPSASPADPRRAEAERLTGELRTALDELLPGVDYLPYPQDDGPTGDPLAFVDRGGYFLATAKIRDSQGVGGLKVLTGDLNGVYGIAECPGDPAPLDVELACDIVPVPGGGAVMRLSMTRENFQRYFIFVEGSGATGVAVEITNGASGDFAAQRPAPPLTRDQTVALATLPSLATTL
jgi:hypothetical protein